MKTITVLLISALAFFALAYAQSNNPKGTAEPNSTDIPKIIADLQKQVAILSRQSDAQQTRITLLESRLQRLESLRVSIPAPQPLPPAGLQDRSIGYR